MDAENTATFKISGKISLCIIGAAITFILGLGNMTANYWSMEKRIVALEQREEKACVTMNQILILNGRIEENLKFVKESLKEHVQFERGKK